MSILTPQLPLDFSLEVTENESFVCVKEDFSNMAQSFVTGLLSASSVTQRHTSGRSQIITPPLTEPDSEPVVGDLEDVVIFPSLPPVGSGYPAEHIRDGITCAWTMADQQCADSEKAFFVADLSQILRQHEKWRACLPGIEPFYAVKCNPDPYVLRLLAALGAGFDCASHGEISQVLNIGGIDPSRIIFANPCKANSFIRHAARAGVHKMTFDNVDELYKIARTHPGAELVVRILTDDSKSLCRLGLKFGAPLITVPSLLNKARELGLNVIGVSFHVGSGCYDSNAYADAVMRAKMAFDMGKEAGYQFSFLDVGGGFEDANFEETAAILSVAIDKYFSQREGLRIIAEPGRFYVSTAFTLAANIIARRANRGTSAPKVEEEERAAEEKQPTVMYYINDGVYGSFNCILFDHQVVHPYVLSNGRSFSVTRSGPTETCSIWGPTCDSIDCVCPTTSLPSNLQVGDWLGFENMGAYTICAASQFNGFETSDVRYTSGVSEDSVKVRRELRKFAAALEIMV